jgi:Domain of unknown function (DUF4082)/Bacterial Ig-like domain/Bacterial Ig domain
MLQKTFFRCNGISRYIFLLLTAFSIYGVGYAQNPIANENKLPGNPASEWDIADGSSGDLSIQGFATDISVNKGGVIHFKIDVNTGTNKQFGIKIYRIGYYNGNGARLIADLGTSFTGVAQSACNFDPATALTDCGNWTTTTSWTVPSTAVSGIYLAKLTRSAAGGGGTSHITFIVRDDASTSKLLFKTSDATWQAYNPYGGFSLYVGPGMPFNHAYKVSYNRPFLTRTGGGGGGFEEDWFMSAEYPMIRFLESNGFDMSYSTDMDMARSASNPIVVHKAFLSVGHDEYWSSEERNTVESARSAGINLAFFSGNEVYWKTRWENSIDGTATPFRTMVCYKEGTLATPAENACGGICDPSPNANIWTGLWRDGCNYPGVSDACKPENALSGEISWDGNTGTMAVPDTYKNLRFWRNTPNVSTLAAGQTATLTLGTLGYEWDWEQYFTSYPAGRITMSMTAFDGHVHKLSMYKTTAGGWVFGAGTVQWAWGLDANHDRAALNSMGQAVDPPASPDMQQATINLFADMGIQPTTLQTGLVAGTASTDVTPPVSVISSPVNGASFPQGSTVTITGTATDVGGVVGGVEISTDGGATWLEATGTNNWTFTWVPATQGTVIIKSRAVDDSGNLENPGGSEGSANTINVTITAPLPPTNCPCTIFTPSQGPSLDPADGEVDNNDNSQITLGVKFKAAFDGTISAIRYFKTPKDNGTNTVQLWDANENLLGSATMSDTVTSGHWVTVPLGAPVSITAGTTYVAAYYSPSGYYTDTNNGFEDSVVNGPLTGLMNLDPEGDGVNGVYAYSPPASPIYPTQTYSASNYWVDVVYAPTPIGPDITPPKITFTTPAKGATGVNAGSLVSVTFNENIDPATVNANTLLLVDATNTPVPSTVNYSSGSRTATLVPSSQLDFSSVYTATIVGGPTAPHITDVAGNALVADSTWSFTTSPPPAIPPDAGSGGPVLVVSSSLSTFSRYMVEILLAQGYTDFRAVDISEINPAMLDSFDVVLLGSMTLNSAQVTVLSTWVNGGGTLIAQRPSALLLPLMGVTTSGTIADNYLQNYLLVNTAAGLPGAGIVNQTIQYHGNADQYTMLAGTSSLATLYSSPNTATVFPAITSANVGVNGGKAIAFAFDLPTSVIYTRQGNPLWAGQSRDGQAGPIRSDNLYFPNFIDFNKIQIPQADEQQHLLTNIILLNNLHRKPLPHLWLLPNGLKAAVVMTGDDHNLNLYPGSSGTAGRFNEYLKLGPNTPQDVADWKAIRGTSYVYNDIPIPNDSVAYYQSLGFEIALHPTTSCLDFTQSTLFNAISIELSDLEAQLPSMIPPVTNRTHCLPWSDWASQPKVEKSFNMRFDVNYYYWPASWVQNRPGMFTGSGMPMRFADLDGTIIDCYQAPTQMPDESGLDIPTNINTLLDNAITLGYYGAFVMNMHTDTAIHVGSDEIIASATARQIPVISAKQMLTWLDSRNGTVFSKMTWDNVAKKLAFHLSTTAHNLQAMVPFQSADGILLSVTQDGAPVTFTQQTVKGIQYGFFSASTNDYVATYSSTELPITLLNFTATKVNDDAQLNWATSMESNNKGFEVQRSTDNSSWTTLGFVAGAGNSQTEKDYQYVDKELPAGTYYYRLQQVDFDGHSTYSNVQQLTFNDGFALALMQNRPNPFNTNTTVDIVIPRGCQVQLMLYDQMGRPLQQLMNEYKSPGTYSIQVNRNGLSSGIYYYKMNALGQTIVRKMTIL